MEHNGLKQKHSKLEFNIILFIRFKKIYKCWLWNYMYFPHTLIISRIGHIPYNMWNCRFRKDHSKKYIYRLKTEVSLNENKLFWSWRVMMELWLRQKVHQSCRVITLWQLSCICKMLRDCVEESGGLCFSYEIKCKDFL